MSKLKFISSYIVKGEISFRKRTKNGKKKILIATGIFGLTYGFVAYYEQLRGTENLTIIGQTVIEHMDC